MDEQPLLRDLVLLGGGHAHAVVIKRWGMRPLPGVRVTLISQDALTPYSGMLPGLLAGHYSLADTHIDLTRLCRWAGVRFIEARITGIDAVDKRIDLADRPSLGYDVLSVDTGSTPELDAVPGAREHSVPVKPVSQFYARWQALLARCTQDARALDIGVVGAGAGGFELLLAMHYRLSQASADVKHRFHWIVASDHVLKGHNAQVQQHAVRACAQRDIRIHWQFPVTRVDADGITGPNDQSIALDEIVWCTQAKGPAWLINSGLALDERGFLAVNAQLQSVTAEELFAAGDIATQIDDPRPKAGVFAVRAGPVLFDNLQRYLCQRPLNAFKPQQKFLSILATGQQSAIASKGRFSAAGNWVWHWKDRIDRRFMQAFSDLAPMSPSQHRNKQAPCALTDEGESAAPPMPCAGCGAKVAADTLASTLAQLPRTRSDGVTNSLDTAEDAVVFEPGERYVAQSVDQLRSFIDDPYLFARIAVVHAMSDLYASGAAPHSAQVMVTLPYASESVQVRELEQVMQGIAHQAFAEDTLLSGGHTSEAHDLTLGLAVTGLLANTRFASKRGLRAGDALVLTKPIGSGVILAAHMQARCPGPVLTQCLQQMLLSNRQAADILRQHQASAMTDVTGFGVLGHLDEMLSASGDAGCTLALDRLPLMNGVETLSDAGFKSTLYKKNARAGQQPDKHSSIASHPRYPLVYDPQTSGGLLAGVPAAEAADCINALHAAGYSHAACIGEVLALNDTGDARIRVIAS